MRGSPPRPVGKALAPPRLLPTTSRGRAAPDRPQSRRGRRPGSPRSRSRPHSPGQTCGLNRALVRGGVQAGSGRICPLPRGPRISPERVGTQRTQLAPSLRGNPVPIRPGVRRDADICREGPQRAGRGWEPGRERPASFTRRHAGLLPVRRGPLSGKPRALGARTAGEAGYLARLHPFKASGPAVPVTRLMAAPTRVQVVCSLCSRTRPAVHGDDGVTAP